MELVPRESPAERWIPFHKWGGAGAAGGRVVNRKYFTDCDPVYRFKVIVQTDNIGGTKLMRGVITAYKEKRD